MERERDTGSSRERGASAGVEWRRSGWRVRVRVVHARCVCRCRCRCVHDDAGRWVRHAQLRERMRPAQDRTGQDRCSLAPHRLRVHRCSLTPMPMPTLNASRASTTCSSQRRVDRLARSIQRGTGDGEDLLAASLVATRKQILVELEVHHQDMICIGASFMSSSLPHYRPSSAAAALLATQASLPVRGRGMRARLPALESSWPAACPLRAPPWSPRG